jgi:putative salt-induced outer membrane protein YdiY
MYTHNTTRKVTAVAALSAGLLVSHPASVQNGMAAEPEQKKGWESVASAGVTLTRGNSETFLGTVGVNSQRKWAKDEILLGASAGYGENTITSRDATGAKSVEHNTTDEYIKGFGQYNHLFSERFYGGIRLDGLSDNIAGIDYRFTVSPLAGYYLIKKPNTTLAVEAGPGFVFEKLSGQESEQYVTLRFAERFEHKFSDRAKVWQTAEFLPRVDDFADYTFNFELGASAAISKSVDLRVVFQDSYRSEPSPGRKQNDMKLIAGIGYRF